MAKAFQTNAFQTTYPGPFYAFQAQDREVAVPSTKIEIDPRVHDHARGTAITIEARTYDPTVTPPLPFNPVSVQLNLLRPDETVEVALGNMSLISTGVYRFVWQSDTGDQLGAYQINIKAVNGVNTAQTANQVAFRLTEI